MRMQETIRCAGRVAGFCVATALLSFPTAMALAQVASQGSSRVAPASCNRGEIASPYVPVDSWIYPEMLRLYSLGYVDTLYLGMRPWTQASILRLLDEADDRIRNGGVEGQETADEALQIENAIRRQIETDDQGPCGVSEKSARIESVYSSMRGISGTPLRDSYHLGSTIINDYGRPYQNGFNSDWGASGYAWAGRFVFYARGEFQQAPSATGYSSALAQTLSTVDGTLFLNPATNLPYAQETIPLGPIGTTTKGNIVEAYVGAQVLHHVFSFGKQDEWLGPAEGGSMAYSNNAEDIYAFHFDRVEPLHIPGLSRLTGPFRYEFLLGELEGHTLMLNPDYQAHPSSNTPNVINPGNPWVHVEKVSFRPTANVEFGFERTAMFGGEGHSPVTLHTFLKSFFSTHNVTDAVKYGRDDPGARFGTFDFSYRLPFVRKWLTLYLDSEVHDDVSPIDAPRRAAIRPGVYLTHLPGLPRLDLRVEAASTDPPNSTVGARQYGRFMYWEEIERQGYTNKGQMFGDWIGREDKGGQAWITYHLSGNEWLQVSARNQKATKDFIPGSTSTTFIPGGTTLNDFTLQAVKRIGKDFEVNGAFELEHWTAPVYLPGQQTVTATTVQLTWYPNRKIDF